MESLNIKIQNSVQTEHDKVLKNLGKLISNKINFVDSLPFEKSIYDKHLEYGTKKKLTDKYDDIQKEITLLAEEIEYLEKTIKHGSVVSDLKKLKLKISNIKDSDISIEIIESVYAKINLNLKLVYWGYGKITEFSPWTYESFTQKLRSYYKEKGWNGLLSIAEKDNYKNNEKVTEMLRGGRCYIGKFGYYSEDISAEFDETDIIQVYNKKYNLFFQKIRYGYYLLIHTSVNEGVIELPEVNPEKVKKSVEGVESKNNESCKNCKNETPRHSILCNLCLNFSNFEAEKFSFFDKVQEHNDFIKQMDEDLKKINKTWKK